MVTDAQQACFEAGIKFGSLYHQFAGTPVSPASARSLERAMAEAIENQPYCETVEVSILDERVREAINPDGIPGRDDGRDSDEGDREEVDGYTELTGRLMKVEMRIAYDGVTVRTRMEMEGSYPRMKLVSVEG